MIDVFIGDPNAMGNIATAIIQFKDGGHILENKGSYWILDLIWGMSFAIDKSCPSAELLTELISEVPTYATISLENSPEIRKLLLTLLIRNADVDVLVARVDSALNQAHYAGRCQLQKEVRDLFLS
jgi:hypothetical protein